jgi:hypothetical protein
MHVCIMHVCMYVKVVKYPLYMYVEILIREPTLEL